MSLFRIKSYVDVRVTVTDKEAFRQAYIKSDVFASGLSNGPQNFERAIANRIARGERLDPIAGCLFRTEDTDGRTIKRREK